MTSPRIFSLEEANAMLPRLRVIIAQQLERIAALQRPGDRDPAAHAALVQEYEEAWAEVEAMGVVVKDPRTGLLDFYGKIDGRLIWLCWKYGEETVAHWHELDAGFAGRKPLAGAPLRALLN